MGYSLYVDGQRAFTVDDLAHVTWNSGTGAVSVLDGSATTVPSTPPRRCARPTEVGLPATRAARRRLPEGRRRPEPRRRAAANLALGKTATASFTTTSPAAQATSPANAVDGFTISGLPVTSGAYVGTNPIWGDPARRTRQDWLQVDLGAPTHVQHREALLLQQQGVRLGRQHLPRAARVPVQYFNGTSWQTRPARSSRRARRRPTTTGSTSRPVTAQLSGCW